MLRREWTGERNKCDSYPQSIERGRLASCELVQEKGLKGERRTWDSSPESKKGEVS